MSKRFTDTEKYKKPFLRGLQGPYKLLWDYLYHSCDHAGIWIVDFQIAQIYLGEDMPVNREDALKYFNVDEVRIIEINQNKWFIKSFIDFQYGQLNEKNRVHFSVIQILKNYDLLDIENKVLTSPLQGVKDKDKSKDKDKDLLVLKNDRFSFKADSLCKNIQDSFESIEKFTNYPIEIKAIKRIAGYIYADAPDDPGGMAKDLLDCFYKIKQQPGHWLKSTPFKPSAISYNIYQRFKAEMETIKPMLTDEDKEAIEWALGKGTDHELFR